MGTARSIIFITFFCVGIILGIVATGFDFHLSTNILLVITIIALFKFKNATIIYILILIVGFNIGVSRAQSFQQHRSYIKNLWGSEIIATGVVKDDPSYHQSGQREFHVSDIQIFSPDSTKIHGDLRIRSHEANNLGRGDKIEFSGKIYRALGNRHGSVQYAKITKISNGSGILEVARLKFFASTYSVLPDPESSLGLGFLVGLRNLLPDSLNDNLRSTGLTHIVAVSGYNLTILVFLTRRLLAGRSKFLATFGALCLIAVFLSLTGGAPSIVRASIVAILSLAAWYYGRSVNPLLLLLTSAAISALISPYFVWRDIGWYLSFSAFFGVLVLAPLIIKRFFRSPPKLFGQLLIETSCAQLMTLPVVAYIFGDISIVSILANLIVLPLIPFAMAATFLAGLSGWVLPQIAAIISIPARFVLTFIVEVSAVLAKVPSALVEFELTLHQMVSIYCLIFAISYMLYRITQQRSLQFDLDTLY